jgi:BirA family biotin operon repressor/biotin-[acetyl-CoA-carboxylase] ligase
VLLSALVFAPPEPVLFTAWAAVAVCETIRKLTGLSPQIKWPNDVLIQGRKVSGILIEQAGATVVGIGLNVNQTSEDLAEAGLDLAGSLALFHDEALEVNHVARALIEQLDSEYFQMCQGDIGNLENRWKTLLDCVGHHAEVHCHQKVYRGTITDVGFEHLKLREPAARLVTIRPESIKQILHGRVAEGKGN